MPLIFSVFFSLAFATIATPVSVAFAGETRAFITSEPGFFAATMPTIHIDGKDHKMGTFEMGYEVAEAMRSNPVAYEWAKKHETYSTVSSIALWGGYAAALALVLSSPPSTQRDVRRTETLYWTILGVGIFTAIGCKKAADAYLYRAINAFNGVNDGSTPPQTKLGIDVLPVRDGASLALQLEF